MIEKRDQCCPKTHRWFRPTVALMAFGVAVLLAACHSDRPSARFLKQIDWVGRGTWMKVDTHIHSQFSDGNHSILEIAQKAVEFGCDAIAITDHADHDRQGASDRYFEELRVTRLQFPSLLIVPGLEWNVPPYGGDEHATVLVPAEFEAGLAEFKTAFDDYGQQEHSSERAADGLRWLQSRSGSHGASPVVFLEHPSRQSDSSREVAAVLKQLRDVSEVVVGMAGAPGHQAGQPNGSYTGKEQTIDRWDPAVARLGDSWDQLLQTGLDVWGCSAPSDFHRISGTTWNDYWPGQFSETWAYVPERSASGLLRAFRAGSFFGVHGQIARAVQLEVEADGLYRPAQAGESIEVVSNSAMTVSISCQIPETDWEGNRNRIDEIELISVTPDGASVIATVKPAASGVTRLTSTSMPSSNCVLRARGRRLIADGADLLFYTNPIRLVVRRDGFFAGSTAIGRLPLRLWAGIGLGLFALLSLVRNGLKPSKRSTPVSGVKSRASRKPGHRHWFAGLAVACGLFAIYGSLLPFNFQSLSWGEAQTRFLHFEGLPTARSGRIDFLVNAMLFVPIGFGLMGWMRARWDQPFRSFLAAMPVLFLAVSLSVAIEFAQAWIPGRTSSIADVLAQLAGTATGTIAWVVTGSTVENWLSTFRSSTRPLDRAEMLLRAYFAGIVLCNLIPFDLTIHPNDIWDKFQTGKIVLVPFQGFVWSSASVFEALLKGMTAIPIGMLAVTIGSESRRTGFHAALVAIGLVSAIELAQVFVESRFAATTDVIIGGVGALVGLRLSHRLPIGSGPGLNRTEASRFKGVLAAAYLVFPCCVLWWPLNFSTDQAMIRAKLQSLGDLPLNQLIIGQNYLRGLSQITERITLFLPFGVLVGAWLGDASALRRVRPRITFAMGVSIVFAVSIVIEAGQIFVPDRSPDGADVLLAVIGGVAGLIAFRLITPRSVHRELPIPSGHWTRVKPAARRR